MFLFYFSVTLAIMSNALYYIIQKSTPDNVNPILSLIITYLIALVSCILIYPLYPHDSSLIVSLKRLNWTSMCLGFTIVGLETGFLLAFRAGWNISITGIFVNGIAALILIPIGILLFKESISWINAAGILLCIIGLTLATYK